MLAWLNALTKLPHCGIGRPLDAERDRPRRVERGGEQADEREDRDGHEDDQTGRDRTTARCAATFTSRTPGRGAGSAGSR